jgi:DnaJ-class molecular chaperone
VSSIASTFRNASPQNWCGARLKSVYPAAFKADAHKDSDMQKKTDAKKQKCKNCEGKGTLKKGDKVVRCQRCGGSGIKP